MLEKKEPPFLGATSVRFGLVLERGTSLQLSYLCDLEGEPKIMVYLKALKDIAQGIASLHKSGIIHRDIKPDNIIVTENGLKLIDLGISKNIKDSANTNCGTVDWMAPEVS